MRRLLIVAFAASLLGAAPTAAQIAPGSMDMHWDAGAKDCKNADKKPLEIRAYNKDTYIIRENLCATWEAPFMYLLIGEERALLIDTGDVADPKLMPLAATVLAHLPVTRRGRMPLLVAHTHRHLDHRAGDPQFEGQTNVTVVGYDLDAVKHFFKFDAWPEGDTRISLGGRIVDVIPTPGHNETHVVFYDSKTAILFSGDFMMPGRLLIEDVDADLASAKRIAAFVRDRPVTHVLGGHIEEDANGNLFPWESTYHPNEHVLQMTKGDLIALPQAVARFNGFYTHSGKFYLIDSLHTLYVAALGALIILVIVIVTIVSIVRHRRRAARIRHKKI